MFFILDNLYLGEDTDAHNLSAIESKNIKCIMNVTKTCVDFVDVLPDDVVKIRIPVNDNDRSYDRIMFASLPHAMNRIKSHLDMGHGELCHCLSARQRSACKWRLI